MQLKNKKKRILVFGIVTVLFVVLGTSYAFWALTHQQSETNVVNSSCFKLYFTE